MSENQSQTTSSAKDASDSEKDASAVWDKATKTKFENKARSEYFDPCQEAAARSIRCLNRNGGDRTLCTDYFEAYKACKKEWTASRRKEAGAWWPR